jgi:hypothetical protein
VAQVAARRAEAAAVQATTLATTLQESLLPSELPLIPGLETAARFRAAGDGDEVGGDFYDIFLDPRQLGGRRRRRLRQGPEGRQDHCPGPVHAAGRRHAVRDPERQPRHPERRSAGVVHRR